jgi:hypothetical protein
MDGSSWASARSMRWLAARMCWSRNRRSITGRPRASMSRRSSTSRKSGQKWAATARFPRITGWTNPWTSPPCWICASPPSRRARRWPPRCPSTNVNRVVGTILGNEITKRHWDGLPEDTVHLHFQGSAGQSFSGLCAEGRHPGAGRGRQRLPGQGPERRQADSLPPKQVHLCARENIITGNVAFYGATSGEAYIRGLAGERFCVRNSGVRAVVEGVGDHACEYMTGGKAVIWAPPDATLRQA